MNKFRYKAFISYSHVDEAWARWLHRSIEAYRLPKNLVRSRTPLGEVPARIKPVFRDRDELSSAADLGSTVTQALSDSENLIVVCSPAAAASHWVREEIREFVRLGRSDSIFCVIVDGEASASGSIAAVFPDAIAEAGMQEPLAADVRKWADGKQLAKLKLISGMLGVPLDQLRRRDLHRRRKSMAMALAAGVAVVVIIIFAITGRMAAEQRRDSGELLVGYKLNELRTMLSQAGDPENLERLQEWSPEALEAMLATAGPQTEDLVKSAHRLRDEGIQLWDNGDIGASMEKFKTSWALFAEVYRRDRTDQTAFFELGQADFWIGQVHVDRGELARAEAVFLSYAEITRRLIQLQPKNAGWVLEMAYALTNLGRVKSALEGNNPERTLQFMQSALEYNQIALVLDPDSELYRSELGQSQANLADAQLGVCDLDGALQSRHEGLALEAGLLADDMDNPEKQRNLALALTGHAMVQALLGHDEVARDNYEEALRLIAASGHAYPPTSTTLLLAERRTLVGRLHALNGRTDEAWAVSESQAVDWQSLFEAGLDNINSLTAYSAYLLDRAWLAHERGDAELAADLLGQGLAPLAAEATRLPHNRVIGNELTLAAFRYWEIRYEPPADDIVSLLPNYREHPGRTRACRDASIAVRKEVMLGDPSRADDLVTYLLENGFRESGFMRICRLYYNCSEEMKPN